MENKVLKLGGRRSTKDVYAEIRQGNSDRWTIQSQKSKYVNGKLSGVIGLGSYTLTKVSTPPVSNDTPILSSRFNPTKNIH